jgi:hypothetical protein
MTVTLHQLLKTLVDQGGTDLHVTTNSPPQIRIDGRLSRCGYPDDGRDEIDRLPINRTIRSTGSRELPSWTSPSASRASPVSARTYSTSGAVRRVKDDPWDPILR